MYVERTERLAVVKSYVSFALILFLYGETELVGVTFNSNAYGNYRADADTVYGSLVGYDTAGGGYVNVDAADIELGEGCACVIAAPEAVHLAIPLCRNEVNVDVAYLELLILVARGLLHVERDLECLAAYCGGSRLSAGEHLTCGEKLAAEEGGGVKHYFCESTSVYPVRARCNLGVAGRIGVGVGGIYVDNVCEILTVLAGEGCAFRYFNGELVLECEATVVCHLECLEAGVTGLPLFVVEDFVLGIFFYGDPVTVNLM